MFGLQIKYLSFFFGLVSVLSFFNIIYSYYFNLYLNVNSYFFTLIISVIPTLSYFIKKKEISKINIYQKILAVVFGYFFLPVLISLPYYLSIYNISFFEAYFESISGFTSTGFTIFDNLKHLDESIIIWRSSSQWIGGLYFLFSILLLIDIFDDNLKKTVTNYLSFNTTEIFKQSLKLFTFYLILTFVIFLILNISQIRAFNSLNLAFTLISSGGFLPSNNLSSILNNEIKQNVFSFCMLFSFFSLFLFYNLFVFKQKGIKFVQEDIYLLFYLISVYLAFLIFADKSINFNELFLAIASSVSNIGLSLEKTTSNYSFVLLILIIIGGSFFSTSSGLRFMKIYSLLKFSINEIKSHFNPRNIYVNKLAFVEKNMDITDFYKYFLSILTFLISLFLLLSILTISGLDLENSFKLSILTVMNTVNSAMTGTSEFNFADLPYFTKFNLMVFMIIGRVELLTIIILIKKFFFKN